MSQAGPLSPRVRAAVEAAVVRVAGSWNDLRADAASADEVAGHAAAVGAAVLALIVVFYFF
ncbi:MAG TPA: hypothetical protein VLD58_09815, partial [Gemmatimonadales bacterium]|nr:hypothetical protein [Gemmatimonadales bacterium]